MSIYNIKGALNNACKNVLFCGTDAALKALDFAMQTEKRTLWFTRGTSRKQLIHVYNTDPRYYNDFAQECADPAIVVCDLSVLYKVQEWYPRAAYFAYSHKSAKDLGEIPTCFLTSTHCRVDKDLDDDPFVFSKANIVTDSVLGRSETLDVLYDKIVLGHVEVKSRSSANGVSCIELSIGDVSYTLSESYNAHKFVCTCKTTNEILFALSGSLSTPMAMDTRCQHIADGTKVYRIYQWFLKQVSDAKKDAALDNDSLYVKLAEAVRSGDLYKIPYREEDLYILMRGETYQVSIYGATSTVTVSNSDMSDLRMISYNGETDAERKLICELRKRLRAAPFETPIGAHVREALADNVSHWIVNEISECITVYSLMIPELAEFCGSPLEVSYNKRTNNAVIRFDELPIDYSNYLTFVYADYVHDMLLNFDIHAEV